MLRRLARRDVVRLALAGVFLLILGGVAERLIFH
jgi:hypothetical protein